MMMLTTVVHEVVVRKGCSPCVTRCLSISRMLDLGGIPSAASDRKAIRIVNASKNSKVQAVAFDFDLLTRCLQKDRQSNHFKDNQNATDERIDKESTFSIVKPDISVVENVASLLGVKLGNRHEGALKQPNEYLVATTGEKPAQPQVANANPPLHDNRDVRSKYASKLRNKLEGGIPGLEVALSEREESLKRGDASLHFAAKSMAKQSASATGSIGTRWMALTGTGALLNYISNRTIKIALLPKPNNLNREQESKQMKDFSTQLQEVHVDVILDGGTDSASVAIVQALGSLNVEPIATLLVSDRDDYIRAGRDAGMMTCRIRPMNAPSGNVSAHFSKEDVAGVQEVIDEMNGISFNALANR